MEKGKDQKPRSRSPRQRRPKKGDRARSRSPNFPSGSDVSNDTQRGEAHLKRSRLFVGNIEPDHVNRQDLCDAFSRYGEVVAVSIHKGYAFVQMDSEKNANAAVNLEHGRTLNGKKINVEFSSAALKAGARFQRLSFRSSRSPPPSRSSNPYPEAYVERERRLARILALEGELQREMTYLQREPLDYDLGPRSSSRRTPPDSLYAYDRASERSGSYSSKDLERDFQRQNPRSSDYYDSNRTAATLSPPRVGGISYPSYSQREMSSGYRTGSSYGREWESGSRSSYPSYSGSSGGRQNW